MEARILGHEDTDHLASCGAQRVLYSARHCVGGQAATACSISTCAPQKVGPALIARFRPAAIGFRTGRPDDATTLLVRYAAATGRPSETGYEGLRAAPRGTAAMRNRVGVVGMAAASCSSVVINKRFLCAEQA